MLAHFQAYIAEHQLLNLQKDKLVLAVSGGADSVCLLDLCVRAGFSLVIAHCNFGLRGEESDRDEHFVRTLADKYKIPLCLRHFDTKKYADTHRLNIQAAARQLRYDFFEQVCTEMQADWVLTAHHLEDRIETVLQNLIHGTGLRGLHGILPQNTHTRLVRPLLFATKSDILGYINTQKLTYVEDSSNLSDKYERNFIRHQLAPLLKKLNPSYERTFEENMGRFEQALNLQNWALDVWKKQFMRQNSDCIRLDSQGLEDTGAAATILYEILTPLGFFTEQIRQILSKNSHLGMRWESYSYCLCKDKTGILAYPKNSEYDSEKNITKWSDFPIILPNGRLEIREFLGENWEKSTNIFYLNPAKVQFPLCIRTARPKDAFAPFGMGGKHQLVADYYKHKSFSQYQKSRTWILFDQNGLIALLGERASEFCRVDKSSTTAQLLRLEWIPNLF